ncbi:MAG TPA: C39 family peptidase [Anaerolineales bacterium]|nr:C39 family peptidase [Anaerolineales bacterium]
MKSRSWLFIILIPFLCLVSVGFYYIPPVHDRLAWRVDEVVLNLKYRLNPPAQAVFVPQEAEKELSIATLSPASTPSPTPTLRITETAISSPTLAPSATPSPASTPLPEKVDLQGVEYEDQHGRWNYCAPANLSMALSFWGWEGNRDVVGPFLKPEEKDKNVMPYEMADYVQEHTDLLVVTRVGGDLDDLKRFVASGYPVLVEKGTFLRDLTGVVSWMGHYQVVTGYDDALEVFTTQDSFVKADHQVTYADMIKGWRTFNYVYMIIFPPEKEGEIMALLGPNADEATNYQNAALKASNEVYGLAGIDQYFAWFNRGSSLVNLQDYAGAAVAYDESFAVYPTIPESERPWRMMWYQTGPYFAYFYSQRYYDVLYLADGTLNAMQGDQNLEESYYWRAMAKAALGDTSGAIADYRTSLQYHPGFGPAIYQLQLLGIENP